MPTARDRRQILVQLLQDGVATSQADLIQALLDQGIPTTQPVISRDLRALGAIKHDGRYLLPSEDRVTPLQALQSLLRGASPAGDHLIVIHCEPGAASAIARALEAEEGLEMVGNVAGDDTVFVAIAEAAHGAAVQQRILELL